MKRNQWGQNPQNNFLKLTPSEKRVGGGRWSWGEREAGWGKKRGGWDPALARRSQTKGRGPAGGLAAPRGKGGREGAPGERGGGKGRGGRGAPKRGGEKKGGKKEGKGETSPGGGRKKDFGVLKKKGLF